MIIEAFKNKIFPLSNPDYYPEYVSEEDIPPNISSNSSLVHSRPESAIAANPKSSSPESDDKFDKALIELDKGLAPGLIKKYFRKDSLRGMIKQLKNLRHHKSKRPILSAKILLMESNLLRLKGDIRNMSKNEVKNKGLDLLKEIGMSSLKTEEEAEKSEKGQGFKY